MIVEERRNLKEERCPINIVTEDLRGKCRWYLTPTFAT